MTPATKLRNARRRLGLTQAELAQLTGYNVASIQSYETGRRTPRISLVRDVQRLVKERNA